MIGFTSIVKKVFFLIKIIVLIVGISQQQGDWQFSTQQNQSFPVAELSYRYQLPDTGRNNSLLFYHIQETT